MADQQDSRFKVWLSEGLYWDRKVLYYHDQPVCPGKHHQGHIVTPATGHVAVPATVFLRCPSEGTDILGRCEECYIAYKQIYEQHGYQVMTYNEYLILDILES